MASLGMRCGCRIWVHSRQLSDQPPCECIPPAVLVPVCSQYSQSVVSRIWRCSTHAAGMFLLCEYRKSGTSQPEGNATGKALAT
jgi:hypothetical protein